MPGTAALQIGAAAAGISTNAGGDADAGGGADIDTSEMDRLKQEIALLESSGDEGNPDPDPGLDPVLDPVSASAIGNEPLYVSGADKLRESIRKRSRTDNAADTVDDDNGGSDLTPPTNSVVKSTEFP